MPMPGMLVANTHDLGIDEIVKLTAHAENPYARQTLTAVVMTLQGIAAETMSQTLGCSRVSVWRYVNRWNKQGSDATTDSRGGSQSSFTEEVLQNIDDAVRNRSPRDHGYSKNRWDTRVLQKYIFDTYRKKYSCEWIRQILHKLGYSHKTSAKRPTRADKEAKRSFRRGWLVHELFHREDVCLFALDETRIRLESRKFYSWVPRGSPLYA